MSKLKNKKYRFPKDLCVFIISLILLTLSFINIGNIFSHKKVLGIKTEETTAQQSAQKFWGNFLKNNPNYIPGLIEVGNFDKAKQIDPNYIKP